MDNYPKTFDEYAYEQGDGMPSASERDAWEAGWRAAESGMKERLAIVLSRGGVLPVQKED